MMLLKQHLTSIMLISNINTVHGFAVFSVSLLHVPPIRLRIMALYKCALVD